MMKKQNYYYSHINKYLSNILHCQCSLTVSAKEKFSVQEDVEPLGSLTVQINTKKGLILEFSDTCVQILEYHNEPWKCNCAHRYIHDSNSRGIRTAMICLYMCEISQLKTSWKAGCSYTGDRHCPTPQILEAIKCYCWRLPQPQS